MATVFSGINNLLGETDPLRKSDVIKPSGSFNLSSGNSSQTQQEQAPLGGGSSAGEVGLTSGGTAQNLASGSTQGVVSFNSGKEIVDRARGGNQGLNLVGGVKDAAANIATKLQSESNDYVNSVSKKTAPTADLAGLVERGVNGDTSASATIRSRLSAPTVDVDKFDFKDSYQVGQSLQDLQTAEGRQQLLKKTAADSGSTNYSNKFAQIDNLIMEDGGAVQKSFADAGDISRKLNDSIVSKNTENAGVRDSGVKAYADGSRFVKDTLEGGQSKIESDAKTAMGGYNSSFNNDKERQSVLAVEQGRQIIETAVHKYESMKDQVRDPAIKQLIDSEIAKIRGMDVSSFVNQGVNAATLENFVSPENSKKFGQISSLLGSGKSLSSDGNNKSTLSNFRSKDFSGLIDQQLKSSMSPALAALAAQDASDRAGNIPPPPSQMTPTSNQSTAKQIAEADAPYEEGKFGRYNGNMPDGSGLYDKGQVRRMPDGTFIDTRGAIPYIATPDGRFFAFRGDSASPAFLGNNPLSARGAQIPKQSLSAPSDPSRTFTAPARGRQHSS